MADQPSKDEYAERAAREQERLHSEFLKSLEIAERVRDPIPVRCVKQQQCGLDILVARCPHCNTIGALSGPGRHLCRGCHNWLLYTIPE